MSDNLRRKLSVTLPVVDCTACGGQHAAVCFCPIPGAAGPKTHRGACPTTGVEILMDTVTDPEAWDWTVRESGAK